jgi:hypothetical protein
LVGPAGAHPDRLRAARSTKALSRSSWASIPKFGFEEQSVTDLGDFLEETGDSTSPTPCGLDLPDLDDAMFLEVACASGAAYLVTGDLKHFPERMRTGILVVTPSVFIGEPACR